MKFRRTMKAQSPKKKEKEINNKEKRKGSQARPEDMQQGSQARPEDMQQGSRAKPEDMQQGSQLGQRVCSKKNQHQGPMYVQISSKKTIKKTQQSPVKELGRDTKRLLEARDPRDVQHSVGLRQLKRGTMKYKKRRTDISFLSTQWCSKEPESLESDNS